MQQIIIEADDRLRPENTKITINGIEYKEFKNLVLKVLSNGKGSLTIEHESGYLEAYQAK